MHAKIQLFGSPGLIGASKQDSNLRTTYELEIRAHNLRINDGHFALCR